MKRGTAAKRPEAGKDRARSPGAARAPGVGPSRPLLAPLAIATSVAALAWGAYAAIRQRWLGDDAFISFRYAENLAGGLGLVYNAGERVEGYSNFLWTLWIAAGLKLGVEPERWSVTWGVLFYAATIAVLALDAWARGRRDRMLAPLAPAAAWIAAAHPDWQIYATSGLETSCFTFLVTAGYLLATRDDLGRPALAGAGAVLALAALARPDGPLFFALTAAWVFFTRRPRLASIAWLAVPFLALWLPYVGWKIEYYGEFLTNTYHAKSAHLAWWSQGGVYLRLYFERYWALLLAMPLGLVALASRARPAAAAAGAPSARQEIALALVLAVAYAAYVARVGGDFMYARLLIPATPFLAVALARALEVQLARWPLAQWAAAIGLVAAVSLTPSPLVDAEMRDGIVDESRVYVPEALARTKRDGLILRRYFAGLPVRIAIVGSQAALAYYARPAVAIESGTGLTDRWIARQPLAKRGRVGHEKLAPISYLLERKVHFTIHPFSAITLNLDGELPVSNIAFDTVVGRIVHWDPAVLDSVRRRGARFKDVPSMLDAFGDELDAFTDEEARNAYARMKKFYFDHVRDPRREAMFRARIERAAVAP